MRRLSYGNPIEDSAPAFGPLPQCLMLVGALCVAAFLAAFIAIPGGSLLFIRFWVYIAAAAAIPVLLLASLTLALYRRIRRRTPRLIALWSMITIILIIVVVAFSLCMTYETYGETPAAYYTAPNGNRLVVTRQVNMDTVTQTEDSISYSYIYTAYPMANKFFYHADRGARMETNRGIDLVEWSDDSLTATIYATDYSGTEITAAVSFAEDAPNEGAETTDASESTAAPQNTQGDN